MAVVGLEALKVVLRERLEGLTSLEVWGNLILESRNCAQLMQDSQVKSQTEALMGNEPPRCTTRATSTQCYKPAGCSRACRRSREWLPF